MSSHNSTSRHSASFYEFILSIFDQETKPNNTIRNIPETLSQSMNYYPSGNPRFHSTSQASSCNMPLSLSRPLSKSVNDLSNTTPQRHCTIPPMFRPLSAFNVETYFHPNNEPKSKFSFKSKSKFQDKYLLPFQTTKLASAHESEGGPTYNHKEDSDSSPRPPRSSTPPNRSSHQSTSAQLSRQRYYSPPATSSNSSNHDSSSSACNSRSPSPISNMQSCRMTPLTSACLQMCPSACNLNFCSSYDKELEEIRAKEEELCKIEEEKRREVIELSRQVDEVKRQELEIKRKELKLIKKRDEERRKQEIRTLECLKNEETRKLEIEFMYRQNCLREEHEMEIELLKRKEEEIKVYETGFFKTPSPEPCEIAKIDRTLESIEAVFNDCNQHYQNNRSICDLRESHVKTIEDAKKAQEDRFCDTQQLAIKSNEPSGSNQVMIPSKHSESSKRLKDKKLGSSSHEKVAKSYHPPCPKGKIIIKHEATVCNGGECCEYNGPACSVIPNYPVSISGKKSGRADISRTNGTLALNNVADICKKLCSQCHQDISKNTDNPCCIEARRQYYGNNQDHKYLNFFKRRKKNKKDKKDRKEKNKIFSRSSKKNTNTSSSKRNNAFSKLKLDLKNLEKNNYLITKIENTKRTVYFPTPHNHY